MGKKRRPAAYNPPRPQQQPAEPSCSFVMRLVCWYDWQLRQGRNYAELPPLSPLEQLLLKNVQQTIRSMARDIGLVPN